MRAALDTPVANIENGMRWYADRAALRFIALRYFPWIFGLNLVWETVQLPLYTLWTDGTPGFIAFSVVHCTLGDVLIGLSALAVALIATRAGASAHWKWGRIGALTVLVGVGFTAFSEWMNLAQGHWVYSGHMPVLRVFNAELGLAPLAQWLLVPPLALWLSRTGDSLPRVRSANVLSIAAFGMLMLAAVPETVFAQTVSSGSRAPAADAQIGRIVESLRGGHMGAALGEADQLLAQHPNFRLAHLIRGDLLRARMRSISGLGDTGHAAPGQLEGLRAEALARLRSAREPVADGLVPRYLLRLSDRQRFGVVVDASRSRLYVFENANGVPRLVQHYYLSVGKQGIDKQREGDQKTPIGVYHVTSRVPGTRLPDLYGWGAFPLNYPNEWDRLSGRTGHGIWIHGVPADTYARVPQASDGCIALANPEIEELAGFLQPGITPVVVAPRVEWLTPQVWRSEGEAFMRQLEDWRVAWERRDSGRYMAHYSSSFRSGGMDFAAWSAHKRRVNAAKTWIKVSLAHLSVFRSPGAGNLMVTTFEQDYRSSNLAEKSVKRQYWISEGGRWKIAYEAPVGRPVLAVPESYPVDRAKARTRAAGSGPAFAAAATRSSPRPR